MANIFKSSARIVPTTPVALEAPAEKGAAVTVTETETETEVETDEIPSYDGEALADHARKLAAKEGEECSIAIHAVMKAKEDWQGGPFKVLAALMKTFEPEELSEFAIPDSDTGNNPDKFKIAKERVNSSGQTKVALVNTTFYTVFADATREGQNILNQLDFLSRAADPKANKEGIPSDILELNPNQIATRRAFLSGRRTTIRASYKKAMQIYFQMEALNDIPGIVARPVFVEGKEPDQTADWEVENTTKPMEVFLQPESGPVRKWDCYSIGNFLRLNPAKAKEAIAKGKAVWAAVSESAATETPRAPGVGNTGQAKAGLRIETVETGLNVLTEAHRWMDAIYGDKDKAEVGKLYKAINEKDANELVTSIVELSNALNQIRKDCKLDDRYVKLQQSGSDLVGTLAKPAKAS